MSTLLKTLTQIYFYSPWLDPKRDLSQAQILEFLPELQQPKRLVFRRLSQGLENEFIVALLGLRRLGKTTLAKQFLGEQIKKDFPNYRQALYYQFNETDYDLSQVLEAYFSQIYPAAPQKGKAIVVLDEIQHCPNWEVVLKKYYDMNKRIKFIVTGSTSVYIHQKTRESLAGRILDIKVEPLSFWEYFYLKHDLNRNKFTQLELELDDFSSPEKLREKLQARAMLIAGGQSEFTQYLLSGEYPRLVLGQHQLDAQTYLKDQVLNRILRKDIRLFEVQNEQVVELLFMSLAQDTSSIINVSKLSAELGVAVNTLKKYLQVLEKAFLIHETQNYRTSARKRQASQKKFFVNSVNLAIAATQSREMITAGTASSYKGKLVETYVHNRLEAIFSNQTFFKKRRSSEVDVWIQIRGGVAIPIEVKSRGQVKSRDLRHLYQEIATAQGVEWGVISSLADKIEYDFETKLIYAPGWIW